jgi:hypothetical protein
LALHLAWAYEAKGLHDRARNQFLKAERLGLKIKSLDPLERAIVEDLHHELFRDRSVEEAVKGTAMSR